MRLARKLPLILLKYDVLQCDWQALKATLGDNPQVKVIEKDLKDLRDLLRG